MLLQDILFFVIEALNLRRNKFQFFLISYFMFKQNMTKLIEDEENSVSNYESNKIVFITMKPKKKISENIEKWFRNLFNSWKT
jgi:hypothetical protein